MSAQDNLNEKQFTTVYHGTSDRNAEGIQREGFHAAQWMPESSRASYPMLSTSPDEAESYATHRYGGTAPDYTKTHTHGSVVQMGIPVDKTSEYLGPPSESGFNGEKTKIFGVVKDIPPEHVRGVSKVGDRSKPAYRPSGGQRDEAYARGTPWK